MKAKTYRFIFSALLICFAAVGNAQTIDGKLYTPFNNYYQWIGGKFNNNLNIPKIAATNGRDTGGIRYNLADSSMYVWTGSQWRAVGSSLDTSSLSNRIEARVKYSDTAAMLAPYLDYVPTLQQVTTAGNTTTDSLNIIDASSNRLASLVRTQIGAPTDLSGRLILRSNFNSNYAFYNPQGITYLTATNTTNIAFPDTGITSRFATRVSIDGNTYAPSTGGLINLGNTDTATVVKAYVTNAEAVTITKGQVVYIFGAQGDRASVKLAKNTSDTFSSKTLGIVRADIAAGQAGWITTQGQVSGINLGAYTAGDILWLDSVPGGFTKVKPVAPYHSVFVGVVERANAGNGLIYVKPQNGQELGELHDTKITSPINNQVLAYTAATDIWENKSVATALGYTPLDSVTNIAGSGVALVKGNDQIKRLKAGTGITITDNTDSVTIASTASGGGIQWTGTDSLYAYNKAKSGFHEYSEFGGATASGLLPNTSFVFGGTNAGNTASGWDNGVGYYQLTTHTSATGNSRLQNLHNHGLTSDWIVQNWRVYIPTLNDGTERYYTQIGLAFNTGAAISYGLLFVYDLSGSMTGGAASANWQIMSANNNTRTWVTTTNAVAAGQWVNLRIVANNTAAYYYINGILAATSPIANPITTNLPVTTNANTVIVPLANIVKTNGTTARTLWVDYHTLDIKYATER